MAVKNAVYQVDNGSGFDEIHFKTKAAQVFMENGISLESGFKNTKGLNGYTKLPNGMIKQWGWLNVSGSGGWWITLPVAFTHNKYHVSCCSYGSNSASVGCGIGAVESTRFSVVTGGTIGFYWEVIGW